MSDVDREALHDYYDDRPIDDEYQDHEADRHASDVEPTPEQADLIADVFESYRGGSNAR